jgi:hypothetical protein
MFAHEEYEFVNNKEEEKNGDDSEEEILLGRTDSL